MSDPYSMTSEGEPPLTTTEPVISTATVTAAVTAVLALAVAFGLPLTDAQTAAILGIVAVVAPLIVIYARRWTVPSAQVVERLERQPEGPDHVIAGEASELPTGTTIRTAGSMDPATGQIHGRHADRDSVMDGQDTPGHPLTP